MRYRSISLNGNRIDKYSLVKYTDKYKTYLEELRKMNEILADAVENGPKLYSELSEHQSYMIFRGVDECVGAINIGTSTDEKDLEIEIQFDEKHLAVLEEMYKVVEQIVESLKLYFFYKRNIKVKLNNGLDLAKVNGAKYQKRVYDGNLTTYICTNERNNVLFPRLFDEIIEARKRLTDMGVSFFIHYKIADERDILYPLDQELVKAISDDSIPLAETFYKVENVILPSFSIYASRFIRFLRNGQVEFSKISRRDDWVNYFFDYSVLSEGFSFDSLSSSGEKDFNIDENSCFTNIKFGSFNLMKSKENNRTKVTYVTPIKDRSSIAIELWINEKNEIERCYIDFRTYKGNDKIRGFYALRLVPKYNMFSLRYISSNGISSSDFLQVLAHYDEELYSTIQNENLTMEIIEQLIKKIIFIINLKVDKSNSHGGNKKYVALPDSPVIPNYEDVERKILDFLKQIEGEIPLPSLQCNLHSFIEANSEKSKRLENN